MSTRPFAHVAAPHLEFPEQYLPGASPQMQRLVATVARVAATTAPVLICGETGTGKSALARQVHEDSAYRAAAPVALHSGAVTPSAIEELLRYPRRTVLLEEISELTPAAQDRLLHTLCAPGANDLRFITTTSRDLRELTVRHGMRSDLLYRLDVVRLELAPLRHRPEDVVFFAEHFVALAAEHFRREVKALGADARVVLLEHNWPGNVRELRNCILESVLHCRHVMLRATDLQLRSSPGASDPEAELLSALSRLHASRPTALYGRVQQLVLRWALEAGGGNRLRAASLLGIGRGSLRAKLRRHGVDGQTFPGLKPALRRR